MDFVKAYHLSQFIDTFALGHYARVLEAQDLQTGQTVAFKVLRPEHVDYGDEPRWEYRAFANEVELLATLTDVPQAVDLLDCGYISAGEEAPQGGEIISFRLDTLGFEQAMREMAAQGWRPYITMPALPRNQNLFYVMRSNQAAVRWRLPSEEGLSLALQFGHLLEQAHRRGIVYLDHKLEHVYWDGNRLIVIDFNSSRKLNGGVADPQSFRMDIHNLCVGILYSVFTGLSPQKTAIRPQPGSAADVEARYQDITSLDFGMEPDLSKALQQLLQRGAAQDIGHIDDFLYELRDVAARHGWDFPHHYTSADSREAREQMQAGLRRLRIAHASLREARDLFRDAAVLPDITDDLEAELRRLVRAINEMLNHRVIP
ncbi:MAG: hypothetical protein D6712_13300 [Chloroflexi bacterium]|nr:MAG: hypothetical protein D6712_13300 [Chloroflexota bacterium]